MIYKISPHPSFPKRGKERENFTKEGEIKKAEMTHSITRRASFFWTSGRSLSRKLAYPVLFIKSCKRMSIPVKSPIS